MIGSEKINDYLTRLASRQPTPCGGAAAALHAAQGAALVAMVARYTSGAKYRAQQTTARVNIDINVAALKDGTVRTQLGEQTSRIEEKVITKVDSLTERVPERIS
jgi:formiminotetrahydrofolate cyclodeaminase